MQGDRTTPCFARGSPFSDTHKVSVKNATVPTSYEVKREI